jgi:hypothetical protein
MNGRVCCYTSFTYAYLSRARVLVDSLRRVHPEWEIWALVVDEPPEGVDAAAALAGFDGVVGIGDLGIPQPLAWLFKHDVVEACTAVKGHMMLRLLEAGADQVVYFDPDIAVFNRIDDVLATGSIRLTPHQLAANAAPAAIRDNEITSLLYGTFNLGFVAVRNDADGLAFARWWAGRLYQACYDAVETGIFTDQRYCDLVPALFGGVCVVRDPGCNVASWNLSRRRLDFDGAGQLTANTSPLKFYHFTKIGGVGDLMTERYGAADIAVFEVWNWYKRAEQAHRTTPVPDHYWHYGNFADGTPISKDIRLLWRSRPDLTAAFDNPFATGPNTFRAWLAEHRGLEGSAK